MGHRGGTRDADLSEMAEKPPTRAVVPREPRVGRVLVVDDEPLVADAVALMLSGAHDVTVVNSGQQALALLTRGERYDVILCDVMMPAMSGADLHARLTEVAPSEAERMVFITGCVLMPAGRAFLDRVANPCLEKPFDVHALRALVDQRVLAKREETLRCGSTKPSKGSAGGGTDDAFQRRMSEEFAGDLTEWRVHDRSK
jgi:CheY-like chemotaxis protein